jgi:class 3 adenylate cyclase
MTEGLEERDRIKDTFGRYVSQEVAKKILESSDGLKLGGEMRELTIMMSDLRGFTALTANMKPEEVLHFLNRYLGKMVEIILDHRGIIDEIIGDGILAFFGAPVELENHPELAVACALNMQLAMEEINTLNEADGLPHLEMGIAVNTGELVVGVIGHEKRKKYGAVGAQVNFTGRVESFTVGGQVLISKGTYERLADQLVIDSILEVDMKGVPGKTRLFDVRGLKGEHAATMPETEDELTDLSEIIRLQVFRLDQKIVSETGEAGWIEQVSLTSAVVSFDNEISPWEDLRMVVTDNSGTLSKSEMYGKVIGVAENEGLHKGTVRFTSVSSEAYLLLRRVIGRA